MVLSPSSSSFLAHRHICTPLITRKGPSVHLPIPLLLHPVLHSPVLCPVRSNCLDIPTLLTPSPHLGETVGSVHDPSSSSGSCKLFPGYKLGQFRGHLICFPSLRNQCPLSDIQCLTDHCF